MPEFVITLTLAQRRNRCFLTFQRCLCHRVEFSGDRAEIEQYAEEAMSGDYDHLLQTTMRWLEAQ